MTLSLRQGDFLTPERARLYPRLLLAGFGLALVFLFATAHGASDYAGRPLGSDFSSFYAAGRLMLMGHSPYDEAAVRAMEQALFGSATPFYSFAYPPIFLLILTPLARLPYLAALALWQGASLLFYLAAMLRLRKRWGDSLSGGAPFVLAALAFSAVFLNLVHGQNGFLVAGLFAWGLALLEERPWVAGLCFGLIAIKPQLGLLLPIALAAGGYGRAFNSAAITVGALAAFSLLLFGWERWPEFFAATQFSQHAILDLNAVGYEKMVSVFAALRLWHLPLAVAYIAQLLVALSVVVALARLWHGKGDMRLKGAALCLGSLLVTPFALNYDLMLLAPAILLWAALPASQAYRNSLGALLWLMPAAAPGLAALGLPLAVLSTGAGFVFSLGRAPRRG